MVIICTKITHELIQQDLCDKHNKKKTVANFLLHCAFFLIKYITINKHSTTNKSLFWSLLKDINETTNKCQEIKIKTPLTTGINDSF